MDVDRESRLPDVAQALEETVRAAGIPWTRVAAIAGVGEGAIHKLRRGTTKTLSGDAVLRLMIRLPGFARKLGFDPRPEVNGHAA